jgi:hypothetical protein
VSYYNFLTAIEVPSALVYSDTGGAATYLDISPSQPDIAQFADTATVGLVFTPDSTEVFEATDTGGGATYLDVTPSQPDTAQFTDATTTALVFTASSTQIFEAADTNQVTTTLTPSGTEANIPATAVNYIDAATVALKFTPEVFGHENAIFVENPADITCRFNDENTNVSIDVVDPTRWDVQRFTAPVSGTTRIVEFWSRMIGAPTDNFVVEIRDIIGGKPGNILTSSSLPPSSFPTTAALVINAPALNANLVGGTDYFLVWRRTGSTDFLNRYRNAGERFFSAPFKGYVYDTTTTTLTPQNFNFHFGIRFIDQPTDNHLTFTPSGTELEEATEAATVFLTLTASSTETYVPAPSIDYIDTATGVLALTASGTELKALEIADAATASLSFTASSTDNREITDAASETLVLTASSTETRERVDTGTASLVFTTSSTEVRERVDASTETVALTPASAEVLASTDSLTSTIVLSPTGVEARGSVEANVAVLANIPSSSEVLAFVEASVAVVQFTPVAGSETLASTSSATLPLTLAASGTETLVRTGASTGTLNFALTPTFAEVRESVEASTVTILTILGDLGEVLVSTDTQTVPFSLQASAIEAATHVYVDASTAFTVFTASAVEVYTAVVVETGTISLNLSPSTTDITDVTESNQITILLKVISDDVTGFGDISTGVLNLYPVGDEYAQITETELARLIFSIKAQEQMVPAILAYALEVVQMYPQYRVKSLEPAYSGGMGVRNKVTAVKQQYEHVVPYRRFWWKGSG